MKLMTREYAVAVARRTDSDIRKLDFVRIRNDRSFWVADPFPIEIGGELYIFGEVFEYAKDKGSIGYTRLVQGEFLPWQIVIEEDYHMSFPNLFYNDGVLYMCPEAHQSEELYLYRCLSFPDKWVKDKVLIEQGNFSDTIFLRAEEGDYGFTCIWESIDKHDFQIFKINHDGCEFSKGNIDTLDFYLTRPAGKVFRDDGKQIMVSQICKPLYGSGLIFKEFYINWPDYTEKEMFRIYPKDIRCNKRANYIGVHTHNVSDNYVVIDLIWNRFSLSEKIYHFRKRLRRGR